MNYLEVSKLSKSFGKSTDQTRVFDDINFTIKEGELLTLLGPSGCG